ncbi:MAG: TraR/DksA C4-type zinc finger protein [Caldilineales bacterium]|nr:TraR/DksA C4-type zinc finger protein [Caldilineales bacterium]
MTRDDARLRRLLEEEHEQLLTDLAYLQATEYQDIGASNHMADEATTAYDQASDLALRRKTEHRLQRVARALAKFESGTYGYCENCGEAIDFARLKALPDARFCMKCQRKRETNGAPATGPRAFEQGQLHRDSDRNGPDA